MASEQKSFTMEEVQKHNSPEDIWIVIGNAKTGGPKVYDVTKYLKEHPGGEDVLLEVAGEDADSMFEDIGHTNDAKNTMKQFLVGTLELTPEELEKLKQQEKEAAEKKKGGLGILPVIVLLLAIALGYYFTQMR